MWVPVSTSSKAKSNKLGLMAQIARLIRKEGLKYQATMKDVEL